MKNLIKFLLITSVLFAFACSSSEEVFVPMDKISDQGKLLSLDDFITTGFKKVIVIC